MAAADLEHVVDYVEAENPGAADNLADLLYRAATSLETMPGRGRVVPELARVSIVDYRELLVRPYRIIYRTMGSAVFVHGVLDGRRDLESVLLERLLLKP